jgi:hypothetical protein
MKALNHFELVVFFLAGLVLAWAVPAFGGDACVVSDNGTGTITLPPGGCEYTSPGDAFRLTAGLPSGTTLEMAGILMDFICCNGDCSVCSVTMAPDQCETVGGSLGGHVHCFQATLDLTVTGTGSLAGFNRHLAVPVEGEVHTGPRNPGDPVQDFESKFYRLQGELFGDPDFCTFRVTWGSDFGLPSPGRTKLTELPSGDFAVDSFFDVTYQIEFEGCPGSLLDGYAGTTTDDIRLETGFTDGFPCRPNTSETGCEVGTTCADVNECQPSKVQFDPVSGDVRVLDCDCRLPDECHVDWSQVSTYGCVLPDNGNGTADMPPEGCEYQSPDEVYEITAGLPPETTIELDGPLYGFTNIIRQQGGSLGGERLIF